MSPKNQQDYSELPLPYERHRFFFVFSQDMCALSSSHPWPMLSMSAPWGWKNSWLFEKRCLGGYRSEKLWFLQKDGQKTLEFWDLSFFKVKFWDWNSLVWVDFEWLRGVRVFATENLALGQTTYAPFRWDHSGIEAVDGLNETIWNLGFWHIFGAFVIVKTRGRAFTCVKF